MTTQIKDLEMTQDLARDSLCAVCGGSNFGFLGGHQANQLVVSGHGIGSPVTAANAAANLAGLTQVDNRAATLVGIDPNNVVAVVNTLIAGS
jgi:hypothetical protein